MLHGPLSGQRSPGYPNALRVGRRGGYAAALVDDLRPAGATAKLSHLARDAHGGRRGAIGPGDSLGAIRLGQGQDGWSGATETGAEGAGAARGGDQDLQMREEPGPVGLVQAVVHAGRDEAGVAGVQTEDQTPGGGDVEGRVGVGDRRWQRGASRPREPGHLRDEDDGAEIEPAVGEELHRVRHLGNGQYRAAIESRADVVAVPFHLPGKRVEVGDRKRRSSR